jgi:hypothetical protein
MSTTRLLRYFAWVMAAMTPVLLCASALVAGAVDEKIGTVIAPPPAPVVPQLPGKPTVLPFIIYADGAPKSSYAAAGWMGEAKNFKFITNCLDKPHSGTTCIRVEYTATTGFGGVAWLDPYDDWGEKPGGYNLAGSKSLSFWARGAAGGEKVTLGYGLLGGEKKFSDTSGAKIDLELTTEWKQYAISLVDKNMTRIKSGFYWQIKGQEKPVTIFIDDVAYLPILVAQPAAAAGKIRKAVLPLALYGEGVDTPPYSPTGRIGTAGSATINLKCTETPHSGKTCIKAEYLGRSGRAGIVWQDPANDMGDKPGGYDLAGAGTLAFWARGAKGGEKVTFGFGLIGMDKKYADSSSGALKDVELTTEWKEYTIPLAGKDLSQIKTAFYWVVDAQDKSATFYLDGMEYKPAPKTPDVTVKPPDTGSSVPLGTRGSLVSLPVTIYGDNVGKWLYQPTGWLGEIKSITMDTNSADRPHTGKACIKTTLAVTNGWGGVLWQDPPNDWGDQPGGYNFTGAKNITFWARGAGGGEKVTFGFGQANPGKKYPDSATGVLKDVVLTDDWKQYSIPLIGKDLTRIKCGFYWMVDGQSKPVTFYLDDVQYTNE